MLRAAHLLAVVLSVGWALTGIAEGRGHSAGGRGKHAGSDRGGRGRSNKRLSRRKRPPPPPPMPSRLEVVSIEPGVVHVELLGPSRPPEPRLFVLTDDRGRRFVPGTADCTSSDAPPDTRDAHEAAPGEAQPSTQVHWQCRLVVAPLYRKATLTGVAMEYGDRVVSALPGQVRARWAEGPTNHPVPPPETSPDEKSPDAGAAAASPPAGNENPPEKSPTPGEDDEESEPE